MQRSTRTHTTTGCASVCVLYAFIMAMWGRSPLLVALPLWMCFGTAAASEPHVCYILDGILFLYGLVLTALLCKIKVCSRRSANVGTGKNAEEGIYTGLTPRVLDTYETIGRKK